MSNKHKRKQRLKRMEQPDGGGNKQEISRPANTKQIITEHPNVAYVNPDTGEWIKSRNENQVKYLSAIRTNDILICVGPSGTGKTFLTAAIALQYLTEGSVARIIITRPVVEAGEHLGFLPGDLQEKVTPYLRPIYDCINSIVGVGAVEALIEANLLEVAPLAFMRGRTFENTFVLMDEAQNATPTQIEMLLTRMGTGSKVVINGDVTQIDLPHKRMSGLMELTSILKNIKGLSFFRFEAGDVVRHPIVEDIVKAYDVWKAKLPK